jgi:colanic acid/amylovoran biosynthesis glycosyltransferase
MIQNRTTLKLVPSLRTRLMPGGRIMLTQKFLEGVNAFHQFWSGPLEVYMESSETQYSNLDDVAVAPEELPYRVRVMPMKEIASDIVADPDVIVLLSLDDWTQSGMSAVCRRKGICNAYVTEYSIATRKQILDSQVRNPVLRLRKKIWETKEESKRRVSVQAADALQCNGTPTYENYRGLCSDALLYFDTRVSADMLATEEEVRRRAESRPPGFLRLLYSGRLVAAKGVRDLPEIARSLRQLGVDFHLSICGDGDLKPWLRSQIDALDLGRYVSLDGILDFRTELVPFVKSNVDLFVCCHPQGDPSCTYLETMSCGVPIVGYANEAFEGIVRHSGSGWVSPLNQPRALAGKIAEIASAPESLLEMSLASLAFAKEHTFDRTFARRINHLKTLKENRKLP